MNKRIHCTALCIAVFLLLLIPTSANAQSPVRTIIGADRIETAILVSQEAYEYADTVLLAPHTAFPDALAGISLAKKHEAPILLNADAALHPDVLREIGRLGAQNVLLLGGRFQPDVTETLLAQGLSVQTVSGSDRYETSRFVASAAFSPEEITKAILSIGRGFCGCGFGIRPGLSRESADPSGKPCRPRPGRDPGELSESVVRDCDRRHGAGLLFRRSDVSRCGAHCGR